MLFDGRSELPESEFQAIEAAIANGETQLPEGWDLSTVTELGGTRLSQPFLIARYAGLLAVRPESYYVPYVRVYPDRVVRGSYSVNPDLENDW